jgi:hypothetical protein
LSAGGSGGRHSALRRLLGAQRRDATYN